MNALIFLYHDTFLGGVEGILRQIAVYEVEKGNTVYVLFLRKKIFGDWETINKNKVKIYYSGSILKLIRNIIKLHKVKFDFSYTSLVSFTALLGILKRLGILYISHMVGRESTLIFNRYSGLRLYAKKALYYMGYPAVETLICQTELMKEQLLIHLPWLEKRTRVVVIPNPVDLNDWNKKGIAQIDNKPFVPYIVTAGRFIHEKGYEILIRAFAKLRYKYPDMKLVILGDGNLRNSYIKLISLLGIQNVVYMPGFSDNVYAWFRHAKLCVISSIIEGFPNVLLQMMSQNDKVVSTLCAGGIDKINGLYKCQPNSCDELLLSMEEALSEKNDKHNRFFFDEELNNRSIYSFMSIVKNQ